MLEFNINELIESRRNIKRLPTEKRVVHSKKSVYVRNQHVNKNKKKNQREKYRDDISVLGFAENKMKNLFTLGKETLTSGIQRFEVDGFGIYFKPNSGESFIASDGKPTKETIKLHTKDGKDVYDTKNIKEKDMNKYKGQMSTREELAYKLSLQLGFDHIPPALTRMVKGKRGVVISDIYSHYKDKYDKIFDVQDAILEHPENIIGMARQDKRIGDKVTFDQIIGNTDRHEGNYLIGKTKNGEYEMIAFDQGLSFPDDNKKMLEKDFKKQREFMKITDNKLKISNDFGNRLIRQRESLDFDDFVNELENRVGTNEKNAFIERVDNLVNKIKKNKQRKRLKK